jgi:nitrite reductase (NO-forming)
MKPSKQKFNLLVIALLIVGSGIACSNKPAPQQGVKPIANAATGTETAKSLPPTPIQIQRVGPHEVNIVMTAQRSEVEIDHGKSYHAWTFNGNVPGTVLRVKEGDTLHMTLKNLDNQMPHSLDMHAVQAAPDKSFIDVMPGKEGTFTYVANTPGVYMYHCGTQPIMMHVGNGMYGMIIVDPEAGYPSDSKIKQTYEIVQSEWYKENDMQDMLNGSPEYVVFNGNTYGLKEHPLQAHVGETIRIHFVNAGPNHESALHIVGAQFETVYLNGSPKNVQHDMQTVAVPPGGSVIVEATFNQAGKYMIMTHQLSDSSKGAMGYIVVTGK